MFCNSPALDNGGPNFSVRIYSGTWNYILRDFVCWNYGTDLVAQKNVNDIKAATYDVYELQPQVIHTYGKTQFRICTNREEDKIDPPEPPLSEGTCSSIDSSKILCEFVNWNPNDAWLELEVER